MGKKKGVMVMAWVFGRLLGVGGTSLTKGLNLGWEMVGRLNVGVNDLKTGPDRSVELSTRPRSGPVQLLSQKGLWTGVEPDGPTVEASNQILSGFL
ncbi:hypothetical protein CK203_027264 [Vitis vinifera]|uniref:Uncharacterized protein n=1 Tax=Vitis vinifera TaxID=29760 RepID=A0A438J9C4_VITVI|nr:hypothetical protein CK203_027264 [Vitis vinifera]